MHNEYHNRVEFSIHTKGSAENAEYILIRMSVCPIMGFSPGVLINLVCCYYCFFAKSCLILWDRMDCSLPGFSVCGTSQARILELVAISFSKGSRPKDWTHISCIGRWILDHWATWEAGKWRRETQCHAHTVVQPFCTLITKALFLESSHRSLWFSLAPYTQL